MTEWSIQVFAHASWFNFIYVYNISKGYYFYYKIKDNQEFVTFLHHFDTTKIEERKSILRYVTVDKDGNS